jgi:hypothetical protein
MGKKSGGGMISGSLQAAFPGCTKIAIYYYKYRVAQLSLQLTDIRI